MINDDAMISLADALMKNTHVKCLNLSSNINITTAGWRCLFMSLKNTNSRLEELCIYSSPTNDDALHALADFYLTCLNLGACRRVTTRGWHAFSDVFGLSNCVLEELTLSDTWVSGTDEITQEESRAFTDYSMISFANSLVCHIILQSLRQAGRHCQLCFRALNLWSILQATAALMMMQLRHIQSHWPTIARSGSLNLQDLGLPLKGGSPLLTLSAKNLT